jgi:hypothetical protein
MGKTSFQTLDQLVKNILENINLLNNGKLNISEIEKLTENTRDLYERLIVIRHKAYEKFGEPVKDGATTIKAISESTEELMFDLAKEEPQKRVEIEEMMSFDFSESIDEIKSEADIKPLIVEKKEDVIPEAKANIKDTTNKKEAVLSTSTSLNDAFKTSNSLAHKLNQSKIDDIKSFIDINKKFSFITNLFSGNNDHYNEAINTLNNITDGDEARTYLGDLAQKNNWNVEENTVLTFVELVERKFI